MINSSLFYQCLFSEVCQRTAGLGSGYTVIFYILESGLYNVNVNIRVKRVLRIVSTSANFSATFVDFISCF